MRRVMWFAAIFVLCSALAEVRETYGQKFGPQSEEREIWIAPQSLMPPPLAHDDDFMKMFAPEAPWKLAATHTDVFKLYGAFLGHASEQQVNTVVSDLKRRHIEIALEIGVLNVGPAKTNPPCGGLGIIEGYGTPAQAERVSKMIKAAGGTIRYLVMDEPLYYGHYSNKPHACHSAIQIVLDQMVPTLQIYQQEFPGIIIGEVEPTRFPAYADWKEALSSWAKGFRDATGRPLAFEQLDIPWADEGGHVPGADRASKEPADALAVHAYLLELKRQGLLGKIGIIHDGTPKDATDKAWAQDARDHLELLEENYGLRPDQDIFQSWMLCPTRALPESQPDTLTGLVAWFVRSHRGDSNHYGNR